MGTNYNAVNAQCPFYRHERSSMNQICCESIIPDAKQLFRFPRRDDYLQQLELYCDGDYRKCEHYLALTGYWKDD